MSVNNEHFYSDLTVNTISLSELFTRDDLFYNIPNDWHIIITDIKNSTVAVMNGLHENVNLVATGSIVSVLNLAYKANIAVPFFFGGDGATFLIPPSIVEPVMQALKLYKDNTLVNFDMDLRTGILPVKEVYEKGFKLNICKYCTSGNFTIPIVLGNGLSYAEKVIKGNEYSPMDHIALQEELDLTGMQCRWDKIPPPEVNDEVLTLLVVAMHEEQQPGVFKKVMCHIDDIYGNSQKRQPISVPKLKLRSTFTRLGMEMKARLGKIKVFELLQNWITMLYGYIYFRTEKGKHYLNRLVEMSDTLVIDGRINTVITGNSGQREKLKAVLTQMENAGELYYGFHVSNASVMSCYVRDLEDGHIHFVDGAEGGYTKAARFIKQKLAK